LNEVRGDICETSSSDTVGSVCRLVAVMSSSACSGMFGSMLRPLQLGVPEYVSSIADRRGLLLLPENPEGDGGR
jgi:hypothetical protein